MDTPSRIAPDAPEPVSEPDAPEPVSEPDAPASQTPSTIPELVMALAGDMRATFPEFAEQLDGVDNLSGDALIEYVTKVYPPTFFDVLYKNSKVFDSPIEFLPGIDFSYIWKRNISEQTRGSIWQHLQLILFSVVSEIDDSSSFGDAEAFFQAVDSSSIRDKLEEVLGAVSDGQGPDPQDIEDRLSGLLEGKIGRLARQIAEEATKEFSDMEKEASVQDVFSRLVGDPLKLMTLIKRIGSRIDQEIRSGSLKESELLQEASDLLEKMRTTPGMEGIHEMMAKMGVSNERDMRVAKGRMDEQMKTAKTRDRLREKLAKRRAERAGAAVPQPEPQSQPASSASVKKRKKKKKKKPPTC
jgi:hypothetical protein